MCGHMCAEHVKRQREQKSPPGDDSFLHSLAQILVSYPGLGQGSFVGAWSPGARPLLLQWHCMCARPADGYWFRSELGDPIWSHLLRLTRPPYGATNHTTRLWFLTDSDGIPDGCDLEQFNKPETDCLLLDTQVNEADADLQIVIDTRRNHSLPILVRNYRRSAQGEH